MSAPLKTWPEAVALSASAELQALVARQRVARPELDHAPEALFISAQGGAPKPIRCKRRWIEWHGKAYRTAMELRRRHYDQADEIDAALADEIERGPDFLKWHRGSLFMEPPKNNMDRNYIARIWWAAQTIERKSWACRKKWKHGGTLGTVAIELLRTLLFVIKKHDGRLFPSYETLAVLTRKSRQAIITAMQVLERMGFVTVHKRIKRIQTPLGPRVVQDSNAYEFHLPKKGLGALAMAVFCPPSSELTKSDATRLHIENKQEKGQPMKEEDRWWLHEPLATGSGGWR
jgi:hypothetical protein